LRSTDATASAKGADAHREHFTTRPARPGRNRRLPGRLPGPGQGRGAASEASAAAPAGLCSAAGQDRPRDDLGWPSGRRRDCGEGSTGSRYDGRSWLPLLLLLVADRVGRPVQVASRSPRCSRCGDPLDRVQPVPHQSARDQAEAIRVGAPGTQRRTQHQKTNRRVPRVATTSGSPTTPRGVRRSVLAAAPVRCCCTWLHLATPRKAEAAIVDRDARRRQIAAGLSLRFPSAGRQDARTAGTGGDARGRQGRSGGRLCSVWPTGGDDKVYEVT